MCQLWRKYNLRRSVGLTKCKRLNCFLVLSMLIVQIAYSNNIKLYNYNPLFPKFAHGPWWFDCGQGNWLIFKTVHIHNDGSNVVTIMWLQICRIRYNNNWVYNIFRIRYNNNWVYKIFIKFNVESNLSTLIRWGVVTAAIQHNNI